MTEILYQTHEFSPPRGAIIMGEEENEKAYISPDARVGVMSEQELKEWLRSGNLDLPPTVIEDRTIVLEQALIGTGTRIGKSCYIDRGTIIGCDCTIGDFNQTQYQARIGDRVKTGPGCVIGGVVCSGTVMGEECRILGSLTETLLAPVLGKWVFVGMGAVVEGVNVGDFSFVAAKAVVTKNLPAYHVAVGRDEFTPLEQWPGALRRSLPQ